MNWSVGDPSGPPQNCLLAMTIRNINSTLGLFSLMPANSNPQSNCHCFKSHVNFLIKSQSAKPRRGDSQGWDEKKECGSEASLLGGPSSSSLHSALGCYTASLRSFILVFKIVITYKQVPMLSRAQLLSRLVDISLPMRNSPREDGKVILLFLSKGINRTKEKRKRKTGLGEPSLQSAQSSECLQPDDSIKGAKFLVFSGVILQLNSVFSFFAETSSLDGFTTDGNVNLCFSLSW